MLYLTEEDYENKTLEELKHEMVRFLVSAQDYFYSEGLRHEKLNQTVNRSVVHYVEMAENNYDRIESLEKELLQKYGQIQASLEKFSKSANRLSKAVEEYQKFRETTEYKFKRVFSILQKLTTQVQK